MSSPVAIIGGTGLEQPPPGFSVETLTVETPFGAAAVVRARRDEAEFLFLARHGSGHALAPHRINYLANTAALAQLGVTRAFATNAVGSLRSDLLPGTFVVLDDFIDFTRTRRLSYREASGETDPAALHVDFSEPYCPEMRRALLSAASELGILLHADGTYVCTEGPRFESPAEIGMFARWGADVVGMTGLPEAVFAREAGICYAAVAIVTNTAAGVAAASVSHAEVLSRMAESAATVRELLLAAARSLPAARTCRCSSFSGAAD